jgi:hypothetical protein
MQRYAIFFITVSALHVMGGFSAHHQELKNSTHSIMLVIPERNTLTVNGHMNVKLQLQPTIYIKMTVEWEHLLSSMFIQMPHFYSK